jgi:hypothetical protein
MARSSTNSCTVFELRHSKRRIKVSPVETGDIESLTSAHKWNLDFQYKDILKFKMQVRRRNVMEMGHKAKKRPMSFFFFVCILITKTLKYIYS